MARQVWYYPRDELCPAWVQDALQHGSQAGVCLKLGLTQAEFSNIKHGREGLSPRLLRQLGLFPVRDSVRPTIVGYISDAPVDFSCQWRDKEIP